jgi:hypothetical protein
MFLSVKSFCTFALSNLKTKTKNYEKVHYSSSPVYIEHRNV